MRHFIKDAHLKFDVVLCSEFSRALQTVKALKIDKYGASHAFDPNAETQAAWVKLMAIAELQGPPDDTKILLVTHHPLIEKLVASIAFGISPDHEVFAHCTLIRLDTHPLPEEVHPLRWIVTPNLANRLTESELIAAATNLKESLDQAGKASVVNPLIDRLRGAVSRHFAREWGEYKRKGKIGKYNDGSFVRVFNSVTDRAYSGGADHAAGQLGMLKEAAYTTKRRPLGYTVRGEDVEKELRGTTNDRISEIKTAGVAAELTAAADILDQIRQQFKDWGGDRALTIATHEVSLAFHTGGADMATIVAEETGSYVTKSWAVQDDPCEICQENADEGPLSEDEQFPSGDAYPPAHPNCKCSIDYGRAES